MHLTLPIFKSSTNSFPIKSGFFVGLFCLIYKFQQNKLYQSTALKNTTQKIYANYFMNFTFLHFYNTRLLYMQFSHKANCIILKFLQKEKRVLVFFPYSIVYYINICIYILTRGISSVRGKISTYITTVTQLLLWCAFFSGFIFFFIAATRSFKSFSKMSTGQLLYCSPCSLMPMK